MVTAKATAMASFNRMILNMDIKLNQRWSVERRVTGETPGGGKAHAGRAVLRAQVAVLNFEPAWLDNRDAKR